MSASVSARLTASAVIGVVVVWVAGCIGFMHGFAEPAGMSLLDVDMAGFFAAGVQSLLAGPNRAFQAGLLDASGWVVEITVALVGAALVTITLIIDRIRQFPQYTDDPETEQRPSALAVIGAALCMAVAGLHLIYSAVRDQAALEHPGTWVGNAFQGFTTTAQTVAGLDVIGLIGAAAWLWFAWVVPVRPWLKGLTVAVAGVACLVSYTGAAMTSGLVNELERERPILIATVGGPSVSEHQIPSSDRPQSPSSPDQSGSSGSSDGDKDEGGESIGTRTRVIQRSPAPDATARLLLGYSSGQLLLLDAQGMIQLLPSEQSMRLVDHASLLKWPIHSP